MVKFDGYTVAIIVGALILVAAAFFIFYWVPNSKETMKALDKPTSSSRASGKPVLVLFHGRQCPHCVAMMPAWDEVKKALFGKMEMRTIEGGDSEMSMYASVNGVPTIRLYPQGTENMEGFVEYQGDRSAQSIIQFATGN